MGHIPVNVSGDHAKSAVPSASEGCKYRFVERDDDLRSGHPTHCCQGMSYRLENSLDLGFVFYGVIDEPHFEFLAKLRPCDLLTTAMYLVGYRTELI